MHLLNVFALFQTPSAAASPETSALVTLENDWHHDILEAVRERLPKVLVVLLILFVLQRTVQFFVHRLQRIALRPGAVQARSAQLRTMATIIRATSYLIFGLIAFLQLLKLFNIDYGPLLASAGIVGVGIGLAAQSLFKDIINGVFILLEDQFNVGEVVRIASLTGTVEDVTLRLTRVRDGDGTLYIIPNSQIATVSNLSRDFAVANLPVSVDASVNPDRVIGLLGQLAESLQTETGLQDLILSKPVVLGVDKIDGRSVVYGISLRVRPNQKDALLRELRKRIILTFEKESIPLGSDSSLLIMQPAKDTKDPTAPPAQQSITAGV